jgi:hypothetical protein
MTRLPVSSSNLAAVGYDPSTEVLEVEFIKNSSVYRYFGVPRHIYESLLAAPSIGQFFNAYIKDRYAAEKQ